MNYTLKNKIEVTEEFLNELIAKSWHETEVIQQQIANIDTNTKLGLEVTKLLKNTCTNYYVLIGCLEALAENPNSIERVSAEPEPLRDTAEPKVFDEPAAATEKAEKPEEILSLPTENNNNFEPFEYFVDFDEPSGDPLSDKDLYG